MRTLACILALLLTCLAPSMAAAHALPDHSSPQADAVLTTAPAQVKIWFNGEIEPVFSTLVVKDAAGKTVSTAKGRVDPDNHRLLEATLPQQLQTGTYRVLWSVVAHDGHHSKGTFSFRVK